MKDLPPTAHRWARTHPSAPSSDIVLLLRAHGEELWLHRQVIPALRHIEERRGIPDGQLGAALAYLEVLWIDAARRAAETEAALGALVACNGSGDRLLNAEARRYHAAVRALRETISTRVSRLVEPSAPGACSSRAQAAF